MVTPELKDHIITDLVNGSGRRVLDYKSESQKYDIDEYTYEAILNQFNRMGLINITMRFEDSRAIIEITIDAHDFIRRGGFLVQEELLKANIQKLGLEIDLLCKEFSPNLLEKAQKISSIGQAILSSLQIMG